MTDRHAGYIVTLEAEIREDDAEHIMHAIMMIKRVIKVEPVVVNPELRMMEQKVRVEYKKKLWDALEDPVQR